jgi:hypothetical protein
MPDLPEETTAGPEDGLKYWAFITYSHRDESWGRWLHTGLETYKVPRRLVGRRTASGAVLTRRLIPIFRDRDELPGAADLGGKIRAALTEARYLLVICSPSSATSKWVDEEIRSYKAMGREARVLCLIVDGEPDATDTPGREALECFPPAVRYRVDADGQMTEERAEPIAADARRSGDGTANAKLKLLAGMLDVGYDELKQRERKRRVRRATRLGAATAAAVFMILVAYLAVADAGLDVPGAEGIRTTVDRWDASVFRPVHADSEIDAAAAHHRRSLFRALQRGRRDDGTMLANLERGADPEFEVWSHSQSLAAIFGLPEDPRQPRLERRLHSFTAGLAVPFAPGAQVVEDGVRYGWISHPGDEQTQAEPALWTSIALARALGRPGLLGGGERRRAEADLADVQRVLRTYRPSNTGGWNMFARQKNPEHHNPYTTTLGLLALLETRKSGLPWDGSAQRRDALLAKTARWLISEYDAKGSGWRAPSETGGNVIVDGLTLQAYYELLRAEREAGISLPRTITEDVPRYLARCAERPAGFPTQSGEFSAPVTDRDGGDALRREAVGFLWYPWAVAATEEWLARAEMVGAPPEERVRVRRAQSHMVVDIGDEVVREASASWTFQAAETLYGLSVVGARLASSSGSRANVPGHLELARRAGDLRPGR